MPRPRMSVTIRGVTYPDAEAAAKALRVAKATVYCGIIRGDPDRIGIGRGRGPRSGKKGGLPPKPVTVAGRKFSSMAALARAIGRDPRCVRVSLRAGGLAQERIALAVIKLIAAEDMAARRAKDREQENLLDA